MEKNDQSLNRRGFLAQSIATTTAVSLGTPVLAQQSGRGSKDKIRMGFIGIGNRGTQLLERFMKNPDVTVTALCDVYEPYTTRDRSGVARRYVASGKVPKMGERFDRPPRRYKDFRGVLESKDVDAVCIATPDHWHAVQTISAIAAGKDVYVEKPLTSTIKEGRAMVDAQKNSKQVVAVGLNRHHHLKRLYCPHYVREKSELPHLTRHSHQ